MSAAGHRTTPHNRGRYCQPGRACLSPAYHVSQQVHHEQPRSDHRRAGRGPPSCPAPRPRRIAIAIPSEMLTTTRQRGCPETPSLGQRSGHRLGDRPLRRSAPPAYILPPPRQLLIEGPMTAVRQHAGDVAATRPPTSRRPARTAAEGAWSGARVICQTHAYSSSHGTNLEAVRVGARARLSRAPAAVIM